MPTDGKIIYVPLTGVTVPSDATVDIFNIKCTSAVRARMLGFEITSNAVAATLTTVTFGFASTAGTGGTALTEQHADDDRTTSIITAAVSDAETPGTDAGRLMAWQWEQLGPLGHIWTPEMAPICAANEGFSLVQTTAATWTCSGWLCFEEVYV